MPQDWDIKPRDSACTRCETPFEDGQVYVSSLVFGREGYARSDYCEPCWQSVSDSVEPYSVWQGVYQLPPPPAEESLKKETAESLLRKLMEEGTEGKANAVYILAVMLERKRILVERDVRVEEDGSMMRVYEHRKTGETFVIEDPRLSLDQLESVQKEVIDLLGGPRPAKPAEEEKSKPAIPVAEPDTATPDTIREGFFSRDESES